MIPTWRAAEIARFAVLVAGVLEKHRGSISNWGRSLEHNASLPGSAPKSLHLWFLAIDAWFKTETQCKLAFSELIEAGMGGYIRESKTSFHIQNWPKGTGPRPKEV